MAVTPEQMRATIHVYVASFEQGDLETMLNLFADDAMVEDPVGSPPVTGKDALRVFFQRGIALETRLTLEGAIRIAGNQALFPFRARCLWEGKVTIFECIDMFSFDDAGKVSSMRAYFGPENIRTLSD